MGANFPRLHEQVLKFARRHINLDRKIIAIVALKKPLFKIGGKVFTVEDKRYHVIWAFGEFVEEFFRDTHSGIKTFPQPVVAIGRERATEHRNGLRKRRQLSHKLS